MIHNHQLVPTSISTPRQTMLTMNALMRLLADSGEYKILDLLDVSRSPRRSSLTRSVKFPSYQIQVAAEMHLPHPPGHHHVP